jgi:Peptidase family M48
MGELPDLPAGVGAGLPFSRSQESEADHIALVYIARAGYDPHQAVAFWKRMQRASKGQAAPTAATRERGGSLALRPMASAAAPDAVWLATASLPRTDIRGEECDGQDQRQDQLQPLRNARR